MKEILFIDDEPGRIEEYLTAVDLHFGLKPKLLPSLTEAYDKLASRILKPDIIIIDIMFDSLEKIEYTGISAGEKFYAHIKETLKLSIPVIILTNRKRVGLEELLAKVKKNGDMFLEKLNTKPRELVENITLLINNQNYS